MIVYRANWCQYALISLIELQQIFRLEIVSHHQVGQSLSVIPRGVNEQLLCQIQFNAKNLGHIVHEFSSPGDIVQGVGDLLIFEHLFEQKLHFGDDILVFAPYHHIEFDIGVFGIVM